MSGQESQRRAIARALANGGAASVRRIRCGLYRVQSATRPGTVHTVSVDAGVWCCTCEAALAGRAACWHRAAVYVAKVEAASKGRVTRPTPSAADAGMAVAA